MKSLDFHKKLNKILALLFMGYSFVVAPVAVLAEMPHPVSVPITVPVPIPVPTPKPSPIPTPRPTITPHPRPTPTPIPVPMPRPKPIHDSVVAKINLIWPFNLKLGGFFIIFGKGFGNTGYPSSSLYFYNPNSRWDVARVTYYQYWSDSIIVGQVPTYLQGNSVYGIKVSPANGNDSAFVYRYISR